MRKFNNIKAKRRITKKLQLLLISYLVMTQAVPTSLPSAVVAITAFAEEVEHTADASGGKYVVNGEEGRTYNIENTDNSSLHAKGNDITIEVNGDTREVFFDGNKQDITVNGNTQSIQDTQSANKDDSLHVTGDVVTSGNGNANSIYQGHGSTVTVEGSADVSAISLTNGSSLSTGYNTDGTSSGKSGDITSSGSMNVTWASDIKANGDISANNINIEGNPSNDDGSNVEATGDVTTHNLALHHHSELVAHEVEVTKDPNDSHSGNIKVYTGSTIRTTQDGVKAETLDVDNGTVDSQKIDVNGNTYVWNQSSVNAKDGLTVKNGKLSIKNESAVNVGDESQNKSADLTAQRPIVVGDSTASNDNSSVNVNGNISANAAGSTNSLEVNGSSVKASGNITGGDGRLALNKGASVEAGGNIEFERQIEVNDSNLKAGGDIRGTNIILRNSSVEADNIKAVENQAVSAIGYVQLNGAVDIKGNISADNSVNTSKTAHDLDETSNARASIDGNITAKSVTLKDTDVNGDIVGTNGNVIIDNVEQTGDINAEGRTEIRRSTVTGKTTANNTVDVYSSNTGDLEGQYVIVQKDGTGGSRNSTGDITSTKGKSEIKDTDVNGNITSADIATVTDSTVSGDIDAKKATTVKNSTVNGDVTSHEDYVMVEDSNIKGSVSADDSIHINKNSHVDGNVSTDDYAYIMQNSHVDGDVTGYTVKVSGGSTVGGNVTASEHDVEVKGASSVNGDVLGHNIVVQGADGNNRAVVNGDIKRVGERTSVQDIRDVKISDAQVNNVDAGHADRVYVSGKTDIGNISDANYVGVSGQANIGDIDNVGAVDIDGQASVGNITATSGVKLKGDVKVKDITTTHTTNYSSVVGIKIQNTVDTSESNIKSTGMEHIYITGEEKDGKTNVNNIDAEYYVKINTSDAKRETSGTNTVSSYAVKNNINALELDIDGKLTVGGDLNARKVRFENENGSEIHVNGDASVADTRVYNGNSVTVDGIATVGSSLDVDNGTVKIGELKIKDYDNFELYIRADNGGKIISEGSLNTDEALSSAEQHYNSGVSLIAYGENSVIRIKGDVSNTNKDGDDIGMKLRATNGGKIDVDNNIEAHKITMTDGSEIKGKSISSKSINITNSNPDTNGNNKLTADESISAQVDIAGTDVTAKRLNIDGGSKVNNSNVSADSFTLHAVNADDNNTGIQVIGGVLDISGNINIDGVLSDSNSVAKLSVNDTEINVGGKVSSSVEGNASILEVIGGEHNNSLVLRNGTDNVSVKTDRASADIKGDVTVANENESGAVQVKGGNLKLTDGNLVYTTSNNEEVKVNHGDIELSSKDAIQLIETGHDVVLLENYNVSSTGNGIAGSFEKLAIDDKSSINTKGTGIRSLADTAEITAQTDVIGEEYGVESGSQLKYTTADSVIGGKAAFLKDDFTKQDDITVWEAKGEKVIDSKNGTATAEQIEKAEKEIKYVIKQSETENGTIEIIPTIGTISLTGSDGVEKNYNVALQDQIVRVKITPDTGYQVKSTSGRTAELKSVGDNIYELKVPRGGGVNISALMEAIPEIPNTPDKPSGDGDNGSKGGNTKPSDNKPNTPSKLDKPSNNDTKPVVPSYNYSDDDDSDDDYYSDNKSMEEHTAIDSSTPHKEHEETSLNTEVQQEIKNTESKVNEQINNAGNNINKIKEILAEETNAVKGTAVENNNKEIAVIDNHKTVEFGPSGIQVIESNSNNNYSAVVIEKSTDGKVQCKDASGHAVSGIHVIITADSSDDGDDNRAPSGMICLFNAEGYMQTGWSILSDENYYYFSTLDGHMYISSLTPDGFTVNELGQWNGEASIYNADLKVPNAQSHIYTGTHTVQ